MVAIKRASLKFQTILTLKCMKNFYFKKQFLTALFTCGIGIGTVFSQTWQSHSIVSQNWPNNDVKSFGGKLYVASNNGLFSSSDNGNTWTDLTDGFSGNSNLTEIQFTNNGNIFARQNSFGIIRSLDGGTTWEYDTAGVGNNYATDLLYYDSVSNKVFLGVTFPKRNLFFQSPTDASWTEVTNLPVDLSTISPVQMTRKGNKLFVIDIYKKVLESSDNGITWIKKNGTGLVDANSQVGPGRFLAIGNDLFLGIGGIWKSSDDGDTWTRVDQGFASGDTRCLYYDGTTLYSSTFGGRKTYKSTDNGITWAEFGGGGEWFFKAMTMHNGALYGTVHSKDSIYKFGTGSTALPDYNSELTASLYPNPANDFVTISNIKTGSTINVLDITGKLVYSLVATNEQTTLDTENFVNGMYILSIAYKSSVDVKKLLINK